MQERFTLVEIEKYVSKYQIDEEKREQIIRKKVKPNE